MDLRYEFDQILTQYGTDVLLVRGDRKIRCSCWSEKTQEGDRDCPICFGIGWNPIVEKHTIRFMETGMRNALAMIGEEAAFGQLNSDGRQYYFRYNVPVAIQNLIVEVDWSNGKPIYNGGGIFQVTMVVDNIFENGLVTYRKAFCKDQPIEKPIRGIRIANVNGIKNYELVGR